MGPTVQVAHLAMLLHDSACNKTVINVLSASSVPTHLSPAAQAHSMPSSNASGMVQEWECWF